MVKKFGLTLGSIPFLFFCLVLISSCSKGDSPTEKEPVGQTPEPEPEPEPDPEPPPYFTFTSYWTTEDTSEMDNWIIIHDSEGNLLDYKPYEGGDMVEFRAEDEEPTGKITVTILQNEPYTYYFDVDGSSQTCEGTETSATTYPNIAIGSHWEKGRYIPSSVQPSPTPNNLGEFTLTLANVPGEYPILNNSGWNLDNDNAGNITTIKYIEFGHNNQATYDGGFTTVSTEQVKNWENSTYMMSVLHEDEGLKYLFFQNPEVGHDLTLDYADFQSFDSYSYLPAIPSNDDYTVALRAFENENSFKTDVGYFCIYINDVNNGMQIPFGYLDRFTHYRSDVRIVRDNTEYKYTLFGPKPDISSYPEKPSVSYTLEQINGFDLVTDLNYIRRIDNWATPWPTSGEFCHSTRWSVVSNPQNYPVINEFPEELLTKYPDMAPLDEIEYSGSIFYIKGRDYAEHIRFEFDSYYDDTIQYGQEVESFWVKKE